jgi:hypothetical protein
MAAAWSAVAPLGAVSIAFFVATRIEGLGGRIDALAAKVDTRFDTLGGRIDGLGAKLDTRSDTLVGMIDGSTGGSTPSGRSSIPDPTPSSG